MCLTQDGLDISHEEQALRLCQAGARWIQVRMKLAATPERLRVASEVAKICRRYQAICIINDHVDVALASHAHGVHLGKLDGDWREARARVGRTLLLGGTVNDADDARRAVQANCLDYVGVGPWRFTTTKQKLAPVLGAAGVRALVNQLGSLPAWAIGGVTAADLAEVRETGAAGAAFSGALYREGRLEENFRELSEAWSKGLRISV